MVPVLVSVCGMGMAVLVLMLGHAGLSTKF